MVNMKFYRLIKFLSHKLAKVSLFHKDVTHKKEVAEIQAITKKTIDSLEGKHKLELDEKDKSHSNSIKRLAEEFDNKYEKLKASYFVSNASTVENNTVANDRMIILNFLEKEFHSTVVQLNNSNDYLLEKQSAFLQEIIKVRAEQRQTVKNFENILEEYKDRLFALGKSKKKRKLKDNELQLLIEESTS